MKFLRRQFLKCIGLAAALPFATNVWPAEVGKPVAPKVVPNFGSSRISESLITGVTWKGSSKPVSALVGDIYYDEASQTCQVYDGRSWVTITSNLTASTNANLSTCRYCSTSLEIGTTCRNCGAPS